LRHASQTALDPTCLQTSSFVQTKEEDEYKLQVTFEN